MNYLFLRKHIVIVACVLAISLCIAGCSGEKDNRPKPAKEKVLTYYTKNSSTQTLASNLCVVNKTYDSVTARTWNKLLDQSGTQDLLSIPGGIPSIDRTELIAAASACKTDSTISRISTTPGLEGLE